MTLYELSGEYEKSAELLRQRLRLLRAEKKTVTQPEKLFRLNRRIAELSTLLHEMNELRELTQHYYDRGYYRNEKYRL